MSSHIKNKASPNDQLRLSTRFLPKREAALLQSVFRIVINRTQKNWCIDNSGHSDVCVLMPYDIPPPQKTVIRYLPANQQLQTPSDSPWLLQAPIKTRDFLKLLNSLEAALQKNVPSLPSAAHADTLRQELSPAQALPHVLLNLPITDQWIRLLGTQQQDVIWVHQGQNLAIFPIERDFKELASLDIAYIDDREPSSTEQAITYSTLLWQVGYYASPTRLLDHFPVCSEYKLKRWPDFGKVTHLPLHRSLTAKMIYTPLSLETIFNDRHPVDNALFSFLNASYLSKLLICPTTATLTAKENTAIVTKSAPKLSFFGYLRHKLGI